MSADWFSRVPMKYRAMVEAATDRVPTHVREMFQPRFLIGHSPRFVGLHDHDPAELGEAYAESVRGWTYDDMAHACYGLFYDRPTIVFPRPDIYDDPVGTIVHEWGHLFDEATKWSKDAPVTTAYSRVSRDERIAEAFDLLLHQPTGEWQAIMQREDFRPFREAVFG